MTDHEVDRRIADLGGLPRKNGELVFDAPWESRAFGIAVALNEAGAYVWESFRQRLIAEIKHNPDGDFYVSWVGALESVLVEHRALTPEELERRGAEFQALERDEVF